MSTLDQSTTGTLSDVMAGKVNGERLYQIKTLQKAVPLMRDLPMKEANNGDIHEYEIQNTLITTYSRDLNEYLTTGKSTSKVEKASAQNFSSGYSIDKRILVKESNEQEFLSRQVDGMIMSAAQAVDQALFYGTGIGSQMKGIAIRTNSLGDRVKGEGDSANLTSLYIVCHDSQEGAFGFYPAGSKGGLDVTDKGDVEYTIQDSGVDKRLTKRDLELDFNMGFGVGDERSLGRYCNINVATIAATFDEDKVTDIMAQLPVHLRPKARSYASRKLYAAIQKRYNAKTNVQFTADNPWGYGMTMINDLPVYLDEMISEDETVVT